MDEPEALAFECSEAISKDMSSPYSPTSTVDSVLDCAVVHSKGMSPQYSPTSPDVSRRDETERPERMPQLDVLKTLQMPAKGILYDCTTGNSSRQNLKQC